MSRGLARGWIMTSFPGWSFTSPARQDGAAPRHCEKCGAKYFYGARLCRRCEQEADARADQADQAKRGLARRSITPVWRRLP
jgi:uncharacterized OB-fold protein